MKIIYGIQNILTTIFRTLCEWQLLLGKSLYKILYLVEWKFPKGKRPLSFDHNIELMYLWNKGETDWLERGMYNLLCIHQFKKTRIIELGCADGFYAYRFYSVVPNSYVIACDKDRENIKRALTRYNRKNIKYVCLDFLHQMPRVNGITNIIWDASINFFTTKEQEKILEEARDILSNEKGILSGCGVIEKAGKWEHYDSLFSSIEEVEILLKKYFLEVYVFENYNRNGTVYFWATNGKLPLICEQNI